MNRTLLLIDSDRLLLTGMILMNIVDALQETKHKIIKKLSCLSDGVYYVSPDELGESQIKKSDIHKFPRDPVFLRENIHTPSDLIAYVRAAYFKARKGDIRIREGPIVWHHNRTGPETICLNTGNCGGISSMLNYILKGKYDEVGFMALTDRQGGHVFNYILHQNHYYFIDLLNYLYGSQSIDHRATMIYQADTLQHYADYYRDNARLEILLMVAYQSDHVLPIGRHPGQPLMYFPSGSHLYVLHESPHEGIIVDHRLQHRRPRTLVECPLNEKMINDSR
jgi:hypothetical protein